MTVPHYARLAGKMLARDEGGPPSLPAPDERVRAIAAVERAIRRRAQARRGARWIGGLSAAAAITVAVVGAWRYAAHPAARVAAGSPVARAVVASDEVREVRIVAHPAAAGASIVVSGVPAPLGDGRMLVPGSRVVTPVNGRAELSFSTGTSVLLREGADTTLGGDDATQLIRLDAGSIELHVAKLVAGRRFEILTPDAEVEVRGTRFTVSIAPPDPLCGGGTRTRVTVSEGVVAVRHAGVEARVAAGEQWPGGCARPASVAAPVPERPPAAAPVVTRGRAAVALPTTSTLAEQNDRFAEAVALKRGGDAQGAIAAYDRFLRRFPSSSLTESATVERMRLLRSGEPTVAAAAAREYLAEYPRGFARAEAEAFIAGTR